MSKKIMYGAMRMLSCVALAFTVLNVNVACSFIMHQPKLPESVLRFKK